MNRTSSFTSIDGIFTETKQRGYQNSKRAWVESEKSYVGAPGKAIRIAIGALIIKERMGLTDDATRDQYILCTLQ